MVLREGLEVFGAEFLGIGPVAGEDGSPGGGDGEDNLVGGGAFDLAAGDGGEGGLVDAEGLEVELEGEVGGGAGGVADGEEVSVSGITEAFAPGGEIFGARVGVGGGGWGDLGVGDWLPAGGAEGVV